MPYEVWYTKIVTPTIRQENPRGHECSALSQLPSMRTPDTYFCPRISSIVDLLLGGIIVVVPQRSGQSNRSPCYNLILYGFGP